MVNKGKQGVTRGNWDKNGNKGNMVNKGKQGETGIKMGTRGNRRNKG